MKTTPFFRLLPPGTKEPASQSTRLPYHDNDACPVGQEVKSSGQWQAYEPTRMGDTRVRCRLCIQLN
jgi:Pyruvate/2-oxoacid:ferredoxin oxidoreductase delta subunit